MMTKRYAGFCTGIAAAQMRAEKFLKNDGQQVRLIFDNGFACFEKKGNVVRVIE